MHEATGLTVAVRSWRSSPGGRTVVASPCSSLSSSSEVALLLLLLRQWERLRRFGLSLGLARTSLWVPSSSDCSRSRGDRDRGSRARRDTFAGCDGGFGAAPGGSLSRPSREVSSVSGFVPSASLTGVVSAVLCSERVSSRNESAIPLLPELWSACAASSRSCIARVCAHVIVSSWAYELVAAAALPEEASAYDLDGAAALPEEALE